MTPVLAIVALVSLLRFTAAGHFSKLLPVNPIIRVPSTNFENLAVRHTGQILATTTIPSAALYQVDPLHIHAPQLLCAFPGVESAVGIAEGARDVFYVATANFSLQNPLATAPDSYRIYEVDLRRALPDVRIVARLPNAVVLNGVALANPYARAHNASAPLHLLVADTYAGLVWNVNLQSGAVDVAVHESATKGSDYSSLLPGVNGVKVFGGYLYWSNTGREAVYRIPIDEWGYPIRNQVVETVSQGVSCDDLLVAEDGVVYAPGPIGVITRINARGEKVVIAGTANATSGSNVLSGPTALAFGRLGTDRESLYITTNGGLPPVQVVNGTQGVSRIDLFKL